MGGETSERASASPDRYSHRFGASPPLSERVSAEIFSEQIEIKTGVCHNAEEALAELRGARQAVGDLGFGLLAAGLHPTAATGAQLVDKPRYEIVREDLGDLLRTPPCPYARDLGGEAALEEVERILREGNGADEQRRIEREHGMPGLLEQLAERSVH